MPKDTFFNLQEAKKNRILEVVIDEFANNSYKNASISRIVKNASIAKGSFYQYFEDKKDLYKYIIDKISQKKLEYLNNYMDQAQELDFFDFLKNLFVAGIVFSKENPKFSKIAERLTKGDVDFKWEMLGDVEIEGNKLYESLLTQGIKSGKINANIDIKLTAIMISSMSASMTEYFIENVNVVDYSALIPYIDKVIDVVKNGIKQ